MRHDHVTAIFPTTSEPGAVTAGAIAANIVGLVGLVGLQPGNGHVLRRA